MKRINLLISILMSVFIIGFTPLSAQTGVEIMTKVYNLPSGEDTQGELIMTLMNKQGEKRVRRLKQYMINQGETEKKIMYFMSPADVKGTSFMNWSYSNGKADDQWIFLPAIKRTKRISSGSKGDYFMGSDFTYDDLGDRHPNEDSHRLIKEETINGKICFVVESTSKSPGYMYSKTITWVQKDNYIGVKREFYDSRKQLLKTLNIKSAEKINGYWTILETEMKNVQKNHSTTMQFTNVKINVGIADSKFTEKSMSIGQ